MKKAVLLAVILALLVQTAAAAKTGSMPLLAMSELEEGVYKGSIADLSLEIRPGTGRVFVNTFPISKIDTQISMRFAKQIACKHTKSECSRNDFIYTIKASTAIVGGPSAGAAAAVLTVALLENLELDEGVAITGTINSGEIIGPVGGVNTKIDAASVAGMKKVLVPKWASEDEEENETSPLDFGKELGIEVAEVSTLGEAMHHFTGKRHEKQKEELSVDPEYERTMKYLAEMLCSRSRELEEKYISEYMPAKAKNNITESVLDFEETAANETEKAGLAFDEGDYYTSASYCFRANINYRYLLYYFQNLSSREIMNLAEKLDMEIDGFEEEIDEKELRTLTDLQAYMITKERIDEAKEKLGSAQRKINNTDDAAYLLAFARERLFSAFTWSHFFGAGGQAFRLDEESLKNSCEIKISEAEERYQYVGFYFGSVLSGTRREINSAKLEMKEGDYITCLYKASLAKSQANTVMSMIGVEDSMTSEILSQKLEIAEQTIVEQQRMGIFPIMGYSYFEYANSLAEEEKQSAMIYAEYALELSNFDFYFEKERLFDFSAIDPRLVFVLVVGILIGFAVGYKVKKTRMPEKPKKARKKKR
jgi:uncharacterized protein